MIRRVKRTCSLILLTAAITSIIPTGIINNKVNAAVNDSNIEAVKNEAKSAGDSTPTDEDILKMFTEYLNNNFKDKYPGCTVSVGSSVNITLKLTPNMEKAIAVKVCSDDATVKKLLKQQLTTDKGQDLIKQALIKLKYDEIGEAITEQQKQYIASQIMAMDTKTLSEKIDELDSTQIEKVRPTVEKSVVEMINEQYNGKDILVYDYKVTDGTSIKEEGFFVGGQLGALYYQLNGKPLMIEGPKLTTAIKNKIIESIVGNLDAIIKKTGIDSFIDKITDAIDDASNALGDLADSLHDKSEDIDDAWDKVFDRFDNDEGWGKRDGYIYYYDEDGVSLKGVQKIDGKTYYFNRIDGAMETGWQIVDGKRCYFDKKKGYQLFLQWVQDGEDWYFLNADGTARKSEWINDGGTWYYVKADGKMATGWMKIDDYWYYLNPGNGAMASSKWVLDDDNKWRYVKANGAAANDWTVINGKWYYFKENTAEMQTGWFRADGSWYYSDNSGAMQTGWVACKDGWSYLDDNSGKMKKNEWVYSNGNWYYFNVNGIMVTGKRYIDGTKYIFNSDGTLA